MFINAPATVVDCKATVKRGERWICGVVLVRTMPLPQLLRELTTNVPPIHSNPAEALAQDKSRVMKWCAGNIESMRGDDEMAAFTPPVIRLTDPISLTRITRAARGVDCDHIQTFDLESFITAAKGAPAKRYWCCPVCDCPLPFHRLRLDTFCNSILQVVFKAEPRATEVTISGKDGTWRVSDTELPTEDERSRSRSRTPKKGSERKRTIDVLRRQEEKHERLVEKEKKKEAEERKAKLKEKLAALKLATTKVGWMPAGAACSVCSKEVEDKGGLFCGRKRENGELVGCHTAYCWKCFRKAKPAELGKVRTTKTEFEGLEADGADPWWMHEKCMTPEDRVDYYGEDGEPEEQVDPHASFAWE